MQNVKSLFIAILLLILSSGCKVSPTPNQPTNTPIATLEPSATSTDLILPSPTKITAVSKPEEEVLTTATSMNANQIPDDILSEIWFLTGGGGYSGCDEDKNKPYFPSNEKVQLELHEAVTIHACGFKDKETVEITTRDNYGEISDNLSVTFKKGHAILYDFQTHIFENSVGNYSVHFESESGDLIYEVDVVLPSKPRVFWDADDTVILYGFNPDESVALFIYGKGIGKPSPSGSIEDHYILKAWNQYHVNDNGNLIIHPNIGEAIDWVAAVGEKTGEVSPRFASSPVKLWGIHIPTIIGIEDKSPTTNNQSSSSSNGQTWPTSNTGVEACHLIIEQTVSLRENARVWSQADVTAANIVKQFDQGTQLKIISGPEWGRIRLDIDYSGWWWFAKDQATGIDGWVWQGVLSECSP